LVPYRCARDDYQAGILLDANENSLGHSIIQRSLNGEANGHHNEALPEELQNTVHLDLHRYPDPSHPSIKERIATLRGLSLPTSSGSDHIFLGVGSDEVIDLLMRVCVKPGGEEKILITPPTYGMYSVCAQVNDVGIIKIPLELSGGRGEGGQEGRFSVTVDNVSYNWTLLLSITVCILR
jgi:histidinol-phosphate aminotransferase